MLGSLAQEEMLGADGEFGHEFFFEVGNCSVEGGGDVFSRIAFGVV